MKQVLGMNVNQLKYFNAPVDNQDRLTKEKVYSWNPSVDLDKIINKYWKLRISNQITEDCGNNNVLSPFKDHKETLRPYIEYFCV